ncbi:hypothetical protein [Serratia sp. CY56464]|uniref:hypothetical protein n=1 Tax=Serratia sp. CY56464 TaxID=3383641 RepID=UPI003FA050B3
MKEELYGLANHIAGAKGGLPQEWQEWADEIEMDIRKLANREAQPVAIGEVRLGQQDDVGCFPSARVICLHEQADWDNFPDGTKLYTTPPAPAVPDDVRRDAERWRAMLGSARIRILGIAGFDAPVPPGGDPDYRHFGMEIWTHYPGWMAEKNEYGIDTLTQYADACRAAMLAQPVSQDYTLPEGWKLVPIEPTAEMINAALASGAFSIRSAYRLMLAAAPEGGN